VSVFGNSVSMLIVILDLSDHSNRYQATVAMIYNMVVASLTRVRAIVKAITRPVTRVSVMGGN
jgi:hypothetical protein